MVSFEFTVAGETQVNRMLSRTTDKLDDLRPFLDGVADLLLAVMADQFDSGGGRSASWEPLSPRYAAQKRAKWGQRPLLVASGEMRESLTQRGGRHIERRPLADVLEFGSRVPYAIYHQMGTQRMPQRKILDLVDRDRRAIMKLLQRYLFTGRSGGRIRV
tara:strand:+ start:12902 stop:13381 length:480 start_codon:yes stop_codon:yes gene_type:complete